MVEALGLVASVLPRHTATCKENDIEMSLATPLSSPLCSPLSLWLCPLLHRDQIPVLRGSRYNLVLQSHHFFLNSPSILSHFSKFRFFAFCSCHCLLYQWRLKAAATSSNLGFKSLLCHLLVVRHQSPNPNLYLSCK